MLHCREVAMSREAESICISTKHKQAKDAPLGQAIGKWRRQ